jgi:hypothetical protein
MVSTHRIPTDGRDPPVPSPAPLLLTTSPRPPLDHPLCPVSTPPRRAGQGSLPSPRRFLVPTQENERKKRRRRREIRAIKRRTMGRDMTTRKRSRNSSSSSSSTMRRTPSLSELPRTTRAARGDSAAPSPMEGFSAAHRRHSMECFPVTETAAFLKVCGFCRRGLGPGRDTFIYMCVSSVSLRCDFLCLCMKIFDLYACACPKDSPCHLAGVLLCFLSSSRLFFPFLERSSRLLGEQLVFVILASWHRD